MKPKTAILLLDKLILWHNINQRHPLSLTTWSHCMTNTFTWHFHFLFWPTVFFRVTRGLALASLRNNICSTTHMWDQPMQDCRVSLNEKRGGGLTAIITCCGVLTDPLLLSSWKQYKRPKMSCERPLNYGVCGVCIWIKQLPGLSEEQIQVQEVQRLPFFSRPNLF